MDRVQLLNDQQEGMRDILEGHQVGLWTAVPGIVQKVDLTKMTCEVQPAVQAMVSDENGVDSFVNLPVLVDVPIVFPSAGGFTITFPMAAGDEVLVVFSSRCIDAWWQSGGVQQAMEARMHDLSDGFAIPGPKSVPHAVSSISSTDLEIRKNDNSVKIAVKASGKVAITAQEIDMTATTLNITGTINLTGVIVASGEVTANGIPLSAHVHPGVTSGTANTGAPTP